MFARLSTAVFLATSLLCARAGNAAEKRIDAAHSSFTTHVQKGGLLSVAGHEHTVAAPVADGIIDNGQQPHVSFRVLSSALRVLPEEHQAEIQKHMQEDVLESAAYPQILFASESAKQQGSGRWLIDGKLTVHGRTRSIEVGVEQHGSTYGGQTTIRQTEFGIRPPSYAGGTVKVKDELRIEFLFAVIG